MAADALNPGVIISNFSVSRRAEFRFRALYDQYPVSAIIPNGLLNLVFPP